MLALLLGLVIAGLVLELGTRVFHLDVEATWLNRTVVGFPVVKTDVHQASDRPGLLYELIPNTTTRMRANYVSPYEKKYKQYNIDINHLGFRGADFTPQKKPGVFRVFFVGSSNTFGMVADDDTYPAQTAQLLEKKFPGQFEIINAGVSGYRLSQESIWAREIINRYSPDLIVLQLLNHGARAFYLNDNNYVKHFERDPELFRENLPNIFTLTEKELARHYRLLDSIGLYRLGVGLLNAVVFRKNCGRRDLTVCIQSHPLGLFFERYGDIISEREFKKTVQDYPDHEFILFSPLQMTCVNQPDEKFKNVAHYSFCNPPPGNDYRDAHPPSYVYSWYARELSDYIIKKRKTMTAKKLK